MSRAKTLGESARLDAERRELVAGRLVAGGAPGAAAAGDTMRDGHARAVGELALELVAEDRSGGRPPELLDVRPAEPARTNPHQLARPRRLGRVGELRLAVTAQNHCAHPGIVLAWP